MLSRRLLRIKVAQSLYSHIQSSETNVTRSTKELIHSSRKCYELYLMMIKLLPELREYANQRIELGRSKYKPSEQELNPNMRFVTNPLFDMIEDSDDYKGTISRLSWNDESQVVRSIYNSLVESEFYQQYMDAPEVGFADHKKLLVDIYKNLVEENQLIESFLEDNSIFWIDDIGYALGFALQTIKALNETNTQIAVPEPFKNEHQEFAVELLEKSILQHKENLTIIESLTENWEVERIALMDRILMSVAISELTNFSSIPVKATLDEFIEISKYYSTPQSANFINGVLDRAVNKLTSEGRIVKLGRGIIQK
ncbi:MAG: transcription antitermination factor NusB [Rikenellaceae bacterium]